MKSTFDLLRFVNDQNIDHCVAGNKHCKIGWVQIHCPFCKGSQNYHLGIHLETGAWNCWRCGKKGLYDVLKKLLHHSNLSINEALNKYQSRSKRIIELDIKPQKKGSVNWPVGIVDGTPNKARDYLISRKFNPDKLTGIWKLRFTNHIGDYKLRVVAPIYHDGRMVSYQGRDYSGKSELRYKACRKADEIINHQTLLYGKWLSKTDECVVVEGIADVWRMGPGSVGLFGMAYTDEQILLLSRYKKIFILFDGEEAATERAHLLAFILKNIRPSIEIHIIEITDGDPGEMSQKDADYLMEQLLPWRK